MLEQQAQIQTEMQSLPQATDGKCSPRLQQGCGEVETKSLHKATE